MNCTEPLNLQVHVYAMTLMKEMDGGIEKGKSETGGVLSRMTGGATDVGLSERGTEGAGICCTFNWKLMLHNT